MSETAKISFAHRTTGSKTIGILALQGDYDAHRKLLEGRLDTSTTTVRTPEELAQVDALILPGGESTTIIKLLDRIGLIAPLQARIAAGMPVYGTCAGMILLAKNIEAYADQPTLAAMDITVARNAFGRQLDSFEADIPFVFTKNEKNASNEVADKGGARKHTEEEIEDVVHGVFIRAPYVTEAASNVQILAHFRDRIVGVRQDNLLATAFHPELTDDTRVHAYFLTMVADSREEGRLMEIRENRS